jgi:hypothetical protein
MFGLCNMQLVWFKLATGKYDHRKISRGFDHRGRLCGVSNGTEGKDFLYWCRKGDDVNWAAPVCVKACPVENEPVMCPGATEVSEDEQKGMSGSVTVVRTEKTLLKSEAQKVGSEVWVAEYCIPKDVKVGTVLARKVKEKAQSLGTATLVMGGVDTFLTRTVAALQNLWRQPKVLILCTAAAIILNIGLIFFLHLFVHLFVKVVLLLASLVCSVSGVLLLAVPGSAEALGLGWLQIEKISWISSEFVNSWFHDIPSMVVGSSGFVLLLLGMLLLFANFVWREKIGIAADCLSESCALIFAMPSLQLVPVIDVLLFVAFGLLLLAGTPLLLSASEVHSETFMGVVGMHRHFDVGVLDAIKLVVWSFSCLWAQELATAVCEFALSYAVSVWYFMPGTTLLSKARAKGIVVTFPPVLKGCMYAVTYHLGTLARGSFWVAILRLLRWINIIAQHLVCKKRKEDAQSSERRRICQYVGFACEAVLALMQKWAEFLNGYVYVDVALTSHDYGQAVANASSIMLQHQGIVFALTILANLICYAGSVAIAAFAGLGAYMVASNNFSLHLIAAATSAVKPQAGDISPELVAITAAVATFIISRASLAAVNRGAKAMLYCFLWDASDGIMDAEYCPTSFKSFARKHGLKIKNA